MVLLLVNINFIFISIPAVDLGGGMRGFKPSYSATTWEAENTRKTLFCNFQVAKFLGAP